MTWTICVVTVLNEHLFIIHTPYLVGKDTLTLHNLYVVWCFSVFAGLVFASTVGDAGPVHQHLSGHYVLQNAHVVLAGGLLVRHLPNLKTKTSTSKQTKSFYWHHCYQSTRTELSRAEPITIRIRMARCERHTCAVVTFYYFYFSFLFFFCF